MSIIVGDGWMVSRCGASLVVIVLYVNRRRGKIDNISLPFKTEKLQSLNRKQKHELKER